MKRISIYITALFAIALIGNMNTQSSLANTPNITQRIIVNADSAQNLTGAVVDANTGKPISGATVQLDDQDQSATTDSNGAFEIDNVSPGDYSITVTADGYKDFEGKITIKSQMEPVSIKLTSKMGQ